VKEKLQQAMRDAFDREADHMQAWNELENAGVKGWEWCWRLREAIEARQEQVALQALIEEWT
jgi:hypothetical protein